MNSITELIDYFFLDPHIDNGITGTFSTLYLLRRDARVCFGFNPNNDQQIEFKALFPAAMVTVTGIDLLAKFFAGKTPLKVGQRFKKFLREYFDSVHSDEDAEVIWQFRNSLLHSFGLSSRFGATHIDGCPLITREEGNAVVGYYTLYKELERAIVKYQNDVRTQADLRANFLAMVHKYGFLNIR